MNTFYSAEKNTQILIALLKHHHVQKVVASPGATNVCFIASIQSDPYFKIYSCVDERSAAYLACGMAAESDEPVLLSCTGATASRNYIPALTEAYYRKLPILAVTATQHCGRIGNHIPQVIDRSTPLKDITVFDAQIPTIHDRDDEWAYSVIMNRALIALRDHGGGPVHINLTTQYSDDFSVKQLPSVQVIDKLSLEDELPTIDNGFNRIAIFVGAHIKWSESLVKAVDEFCEKYNAVVFCDQTSNYHGKYRCFYALLSYQVNSTLYNKIDLLIHIGEVSGSYLRIKPRQVWRVNSDGVVRDSFQKLRYVFEMSEEAFFNKYNSIENKTKSTEFYEFCKNQYDYVYQKIPELPFSNMWIALMMHDKLPQNSALHLGILNTLRSWNFFETPNNITGFCNTGGFGIDGVTSSAVGASLVSPEKLIFCVIGDLAFFYDLNSIGNRHIGKNLRILVINNGVGAEFKLYSHRVARFGDDGDYCMAARGHYGNKSKTLLKHYATDLGFDYLSASTKEEFTNQLPTFLSKENDKSILFEVFTDSKLESDSLYAMERLVSDASGVTKTVVKKILGKKGIETIKSVINR